MSTFAIKPLDDAPPIRSALGELLVETVASGGSVSFMHPLPLDDACAFWRIRSAPPHAASASCSAHSTARR